MKDCTCIDDNRPKYICQALSFYTFHIQSVQFIFVDVNDFREIWRLRKPLKVQYFCTDVMPAKYVICITMFKSVQLILSKDIHHNIKT